MKLRLVLIILLISVVCLFALTRQDVWGNGIKFFVGFRPQVDTAWILDIHGDTIYPKYVSVFKKGKWYVGEAYCWGGWDTPEIFLGRINSGVCPGGYNTSDYGLRPDGTSNARYYLAGIDCAAFVNRCLQLDYGQGIQGIKDNCLKIDKRQAKLGDALVIPTHSRLVVENVYPNVYILESTPPQVRGTENPIPIGGYEAYSIFPQFANEKPTNGSEVYEKRPEISVEVTGSGQIDIPYMLLDGNSVPVSCQQIQNGVKAIYMPTSDLKYGPHTVEIQATNNRVNLYEDTYAWQFEVHGECPVVVFTDPQAGAHDVDIYQKIKVVFNKAMDTVSVREAMEVKNKDRDSDVEIKEITWDNDMKTMEVRCYDPVGEYES
ncbi:MAG: Ig-like domain-containing protein [candidate division WOR-3 bacterium]